MASQAAAEVATLAAAIRKQHAAGTYEWSLPANYSLTYDKLQGEVYVAGVYVRLFLKNPRYAIRDPQRFIEGLMERYLHEVPAAGSGGAEAAGGKAGDSLVLLLSAAVVAVLQGHALLADHVAQLGYANRLLSNLARRTAGLPMPVAGPRQAAAAGGGEGGGGSGGGGIGGGSLVKPDEIGGSMLRVLHQLASSPVAAEALAASTSAPFIPTCMKATAWGHGASLLVLETFKRALNVNNRQRDVLVSQAVSAQLPQQLLHLLDWRGAGEGGKGAGGEGGPVEQEAAVQRALAVDVLQLLAEEGAAGGHVAALLQRSDVWQAYSGQRHDMFLPSGATADSGVVGLLTGGETARFALPAPEENK
jgi:DnaJ family protein C protein 13